MNVYGSIDFCAPCCERFDKQRVLIGRSYFTSSSYPFAMETTRILTWVFIFLLHWSVIFSVYIVIGPQ